MNETLLVVLITVASRDEGGRIARHLVDARLAACINLVGPIRSIYRWQGTVRDDEEWQLLIKTRADLFDAVAAAVRDVHSYENPEILALPVAAAARAYGDWVREATQA
jgi:periplasmic divalent cation tolerance protein